MRVLMLGGTGEARALAAELVAAEVDVLSSLAGRVSEPHLPVGDVRIGGFGGVDGLVSFLRTDGIDAVVDATHPFAATISAHAADACAATGVPRLVLRRPAWHLDAAWSVCPDIASAAAQVTAWPGESVFLTTGRRDLAAFAGDTAHHYLVRAVDPPEGRTPPNMTLLLARGPYTLVGERALLIEHDVGLLVTKNSGGDMTRAKLDAARELGVGVVVVQRPELPAGSTVVDDVSAAAQWLNSAAE